MNMAARERVVRVADGGDAANGAVVGVTAAGGLKLLLPRSVSLSM
jgi:hypothetical protein